ncbi:hypothetical protein ABW20_dc0107359 [Dactylellina cionopaga]|nr:hypothetical protein ABW20_dc0107359 [Dactylellina cionopaga]
MEQDSHVLIFVHNTATTNAKADAQYREQALAHLRFAGTRVNLDGGLEQHQEELTEEAYTSQKRPLLFYSSDDEEQNGRKKRTSFTNREPVVQVESSPDVVKSTAPELSTFVCDPMPNVPSQHAFTLEPVTPQPPSVSRVPETVFRPDSPSSPLIAKGTPQTSSISRVPETVLRPASDSQHPLLECSSPIEYDLSSMEIPDSQPTPPRRKIFPSSSGHTTSEPADDSTITHVSQSPPGSGAKRSTQDRDPFLQPSSQTSVKTPTRSPAIAVVNDKTIASVIEVSPLAPSEAPVTPNTRRVIQVYPPPPKLSSLSPVSPLEHYSLPETFTSPDKLPQRFPLFTGQPVSPRSLLAYMLEKDLDSVDRQLLKGDKKQVSRYLELRQLSEYNITSPAPGVNSNPKQVTPMMEKLYTQAKLDKYFRPKIFARGMRRRERGYWRIDLSRWPRGKSNKENGAFGSTAEKKHGFWTRLAGYVKDGKLGETRLFFESESEGAVSELALKWVDSGGHIVIEM